MDAMTEVRRTTWWLARMALCLCLLIVFGHAPARAEVVGPLPDRLQAAVDRVLPSKPGDLFVVLKNGMTLLIRETPDRDVVSAQIFVRTGSMYEGEALGAGLSHYLEHVVAGGSTRSFSEEEARVRLEKLGGASNAYTSHDRTVYYIDTGSGHWRQALDLLLSYVSECRFEESEVKREKAVIQQEFKLGENNSRRRLWQLFLQTAYQVHPVRYPVIGYENIFVQQTRKDLLDYYLDHYRPQNIVVAVAGKVKATAVAAYVAERTRSFHRGHLSDPVLPAEPRQINGRWAETTLPFARLTQAIVSFPSVALTDPDLYPLDVLAILLGEGRTSRLYQRLKDQENRVLSVSAYNWTPSYVRGQFIISMTLAPHQWPGIIALVKEEIQRFKDRGATREELEKAKKKVIAEHIFGQETASEMASSLGSSYLDTGDPYFDETYVKGIRAVSLDAVERVARQYLNPMIMNVAAVQPESRAGSKVEPTAQTPPAAAPQAEAKVKMIALDNKLRVLLKEDHALPLVTIQLYGTGGLLLEPADQPGIAAFTSALLTAGTKSRTKQQIASAIEDVGGSITSGSGNNTYYLSIDVLKEDLDMALDILADLVLHSQFPEREIEKRRRETLLAIQSRDENWQSEVMRLFKHAYFKNHPYRHDLLGTSKSVASFTRTDIVRCYHRMVRPQHSVLAVFGDIDAAATGARIKKLLSGWQPGQSVLPAWPDETHNLDSDRLREKKNRKVSAALFIGTNGMSLDDPMRPALDVLDALLSGIGYPSGRLQKALRGGRADLVYLVHAFPFYGVKGGYFGVISQTTLANLDKVQQIVLRNLRDLKDHPVSGAELATAKDMVLTMHLLSLESLNTQARDAALNEVLGLGWDYDRRYASLIEKVSTDDVRQVARRLFDHTLVVRTIPLHPVEVLKPQPPQPDYR